MELIGSVFPLVDTDIMDAYNVDWFGSYETMRAIEEPFAGYREKTRLRLRELMLKDGYHPGHPLVVATGQHLEMGTAEKTAEKYWTVHPTQYYQGCDLIYKVPCRPASPISPAPARNPKRLCSSSP